MSYFHHFFLEFFPIKKAVFIYNSHLARHLTAYLIWALRTPGSGLVAVAVGVGVAVAVARDLPRLWQWQWQWQWQWGWQCV
jgi:hypothetical protein